MPSSEAKFEVVDQNEWPGAKTNAPSEMSLRLEKGEVLFVPSTDRRVVFNNQTSYLALRGWKVESRTGERNGVRGVFYRAVRVNQVDTTPQSATIE